jgi:hypothetical protein
MRGLPETILINACGDAGHKDSCIDRLQHSGGRASGERRESRTAT